MKFFPDRGFTLIELLVVISIIALLSAIGAASLNSTRKKARIAKRTSDIHTIKTALDLYYDTNNAYPLTADAWRSECSTWGSYAPDQVIPGILPTYLSQLPKDPQHNTPVNKNCYIYRANGTGSEYKFIDNGIEGDLSQSDFLLHPSFIDPRRDGGPSIGTWGDTTGCNGAGDNTAITAFALSTPGGRCM